MRILYGVVGEGMGHATRSRVVLEHLLTAGHEVLVVVSGRACGFLTEALAARPQARVIEIAGLTMAYSGNALDLPQTVRENLGRAPEGLRRNLSVFRGEVSDFDPEVIFTDFDSFTYLFGRTHRLPVISIDNIQMLNRCEHSGDVTDGKCASFRLARAATKARLPGAHHYLITTFFFPPVRKARTTLVPPILRPEIRAAAREPGEHVLVYQTATANEELVPTLRKLPFEFRVYGLRREETLGNVRLRDFSQQGFVDDLRTARAVIAGGGFSLMGEAVHLGVPMLSIPLEGQYEQQLNAHYLARLGYGEFAPRLDGEVVERFLGKLAEYAAAVSGYERQGDELLFASVDRLLEGISGGDPPAPI